jgi:hypothetical protein
MTTQTKKIRKQILQNQIFRLAKLAVMVGARDLRFMRIVNLQCECIKEKKSL